MKLKWEKRGVGAWTAKVGENVEWLVMATSGRCVGMLQDRHIRYPFGYRTLTTVRACNPYTCKRAAQRMTDKLAAAFEADKPKGPLVWCIEKESANHSKMIVFAPSGYPTFTRRSDVIALFLEWWNYKRHFPDTWKQLKARGYRCVRKQLCGVEET